MQINTDVRYFAKKDFLTFLQSIDASKEGGDIMDERGIYHYVVTIPSDKEGKFRQFCARDLDISLPE